MFTLELTVQASQKWEKEGRKFNSLTVTAFGYGVMKITIPEAMLPDVFDGQTFTGEFDIGVDRKTFKPYLKFKGVK